MNLISNIKIKVVKSYFNSDAPFSKEHLDSMYLLFYNKFFNFTIKAICALISFILCLLIALIYPSEPLWAIVSVLMGSLFIGLCMLSCYFYFKFKLYSILDYDSYSDNLLLTEINSVSELNSAIKSYLLNLKKFNRNPCAGEAILLLKKGFNSENQNEQ